ncbi:hypothetical protein FISHEDRAFT_67446 [Fistulina hepatica ATCC 64428]|uniref:Vacuolar sorting protein Vps3844 C-terminal domain-containing protein n=1 Tax=Fistulina hepatica ATCC 64428 TaxID=1128425 RepID=A0A0D7A0H1_9AGAR|nr:hypothetical protein FISHEDRAFT_67446 [Fistulina hepatica ATCC 64428]
MYHPALSLAAVFLSARFCRAIDVYLYPHSSPVRHSILSVDDASAALASHLGLEAFEPVHEDMYVEQTFVGHGWSDALLLSLEDEDAWEVLGSSEKPSFILQNPSSSHVESLSSVISTFIHRAGHVYSSVLDATSSHEQIQSLEAFFSRAGGPSFAAAELTMLPELRQIYGTSSEQYESAVRQVRQLIERVSADNRIRLAVLTYFPSPSSTFHRRSLAARQSQSPLPPDHLPPSIPNGAVSTCFESADTCTNSTNLCSGRGECVAVSKTGRTCYVCACSATKTGTGNKIKTDYWVGESCERKDISGPFVLLSGSVIAIVLLIAGSISLLYGVGQVELPSVLVGGVVNGKKD